MTRLYAARLLASACCAAVIAWSGLASAAPIINSVTPGGGAVLHSAVTVTVKTTAVTYPVSKVTADVGGQLLTLTYNAGTNAWSGYLASLANVAFGPIDITVIAYDTAPSQSTTVVSLFHDENPLVKHVGGRIGVYQPTSMPIRVTCTDDDPNGCVSMNLSLDTPNNGTVVLATGTSVIDTVLDLSPYDGQDVRLWWRGYDSRNQMGLYSSDFRVISTPPPICQVWGPPNTNNSGPNVLDVDADRVLTQNGLLLDRRTKQQTTIPKPAGFTSSAGWGALFPGGAVLSYSQDQTSFAQLWHAGAAAGGVDGRAVNARFTLLGNYLCGATNVLSSPDGLYSGCANTSSFMSANGAACATAIVADPDIQVHNASCDAGNVAYVFSTKSIPGTDHRGLRFRDRNGNVEDLVTERVGYDAQPRRQSNATAVGMRNVYDVAGDWVVFTALDAQGIRQYSRRAPNGALSVITQSPSNNNNATFSALSSTGELLVEAPLGGGAYWGLHLIGIGEVLSQQTFLAPMATWGWDSVWRDGRWKFLGDRGAYELNDGANKSFDCPAPPQIMGDAGVDGSSDGSVPQDGGSTSSSSSSSSSTSSSSSGSSSSSSSGATSSGGSSSSGVVDGGAANGDANNGESSSCSSRTPSGASSLTLALSALAMFFGIRRRKRS